MLTILAGVATWEREIMLERQREGIAKAKGEGKYQGPGADSGEAGGADQGDGRSGREAGTCCQASRRGPQLGLQDAGHVGALTEQL